MAEEKPSKSHILQRAWAAGVFEARVYWPRRGCVLKFESNDESMMFRFKEIVGVGNMFQRTKKLATEPWVFTTSSADSSRDLLLLLAPFFSSKRLKQAGEMVARIERNALWIKQNPEKAASLVTAPAE